MNEITITFFMKAIIYMVQITYKIKDIVLFYLVMSTELLLKNCGTL